MNGYLVTIGRDFDDREACILLADTPEEARAKANFGYSLDADDREAYLDVIPLPACDGKARITPADYIEAGCSYGCEECDRQIWSVDIDDGQGFIAADGVVWCLTHVPVTVRRVVNVKSGEPYDVYVGRANNRYDLPQSPWANPFVVGRNGNREQVVSDYAVWIHTQPELMTRLPELRGKTLACWCAPKECHADVLVALANEIGSKG